MTKRRAGLLHDWITRAVFAAFALLVVLSNQFDWDQFLTFFEVELRSWLVDHTPPLWSYQLCAGVTRIGDPQAFGLSPLFLPILVFGSFWGAKLLAFSCAVLGYVYGAKILALVGESGDANDDRLLYRSLSLFFVFGNYFLWHFFLGQLTFALMLFALVPSYYLLLGCREKLSLPQLGLLGLSAFGYCSAGFYHSAMFFVVPVSFLAVPLFLAVHFALERRLKISRCAWQSFAAASLAVALAAYKWLGVIRYQSLFPRQLASPEPEAASLFQTAVRLLAPTWDYRYLGFLEDWGPWMIYEYSSFSALPWAILAVAGFTLLRRERTSLWRKAWGWELLACFALVLFLCLGESAPIPLFPWLNRELFHGSARVTGRYLVGLCLVMALFLARYLSLSAGARKFYFGKILPAGLAVTLVNILGFLPLTNLEAFSRAAFAPVNPVAEMNALVPVKLREVQPIGESYMYPTVSAGMIVPNCYQPLSREKKIGHERWRSPVLPPLVDGKLDLLAPGATPVSEECRRSAFVTQNSLHFDTKLCPRDLCFHINMRNIYEASPLVWNEGRQLYCVSEN